MLKNIIFPRWRGVDGVGVYYGVRAAWKFNSALMSFVDFTSRVFKVAEDESTLVKLMVGRNQFCSNV
jgi:hypothetical protein